MHALALAWLSLGALYHPEFIRPLHGPGLIDCGHGFETALRAYFTSFGQKDGLPVFGVPERLVVETPGAPISHFTAQLKGETYHGFVFVDPTMTEGDMEPWEDDDSDKDKVCSAVFVDGQATLDERRELDYGWNEIVFRLQLNWRAQVPFVPDPAPAAKPRSRRSGPRASR